MNNTIRSDESHPQQVLGARYSISTTLLRWLELIGVRMEYGKLRRAQAEDLWWVSSGEEVTGPHAFGAVLKALREGAGPLHVVHDSQAREEDPPWKTLAYRPLWLNRTVVTLWTLGCVGILSLLGWALIVSTAPVRWHAGLNALFLPVPAWLTVRQLWRHARPFSAPPGVRWLVPAMLLAVAWALNLTPQILWERGQAGWAQATAYFVESKDAAVAALPTPAREEQEATVGPVAAVG